MGVIGYEAHQHEGRWYVTQMGGDAGQGKDLLEAMRHALINTGVRLKGVGSFQIAIDVHPED